MTHYFRVLDAESARYLRRMEDLQKQFWERVLQVLPLLITDKIDSADVRKFYMKMKCYLGWATPTSFGTDLAIRWKARRGPMHGHPISNASSFESQP